MDIIKEKINDIRMLLDKLISKNDENLYDGKILEISRQLDILIAEYYEKSSFNY